MLANFVPVVDSPNNYEGYGVQVDRSALEYRLVERICSQTVYGRISGAQGLYIVTPTGRLLAGSTDSRSPERALAAMQQGLGAYRRMGRAERLLPAAPNPATDRLRRLHDTVTAPRDGLILRMVSRGLPFPGVGPDDTRHTTFYKLDRVWYRKDEARRFLPEQLTTGAKTNLSGPALDRLVLLNLGVFIQPNPNWQRHEVQQATLTSTVTAVRNEVATVRFDGSAHMVANHQYNQRSYECDLLGVATYNTTQEKFTAFELLAVGMHTMGPSERDNQPRTTPLGVLFTLNGTNSNDNAPPHYLRLYGWPGTGRGL